MHLQQTNIEWTLFWNKGHTSKGMVIMLDVEDLHTQFHTKNLFLLQATSI
jgi:hypothetical protein